MKFHFYQLFLSILMIPSILTGCGQSPNMEFQSLVLQQPFVESVEPNTGTKLIEPIRFTLHFSQRLAIENITPDSVTLIQGNLDPKLMEKPQDLIKDINDGSLTQTPLNYELQGDERTLVLLPQTPLAQGVYSLVVTPRLTSISGVPFNQVPGKTPQAFLASFAFGENVSLNTDPTKDPEIVLEFGPEPEFALLNEVLYDGLSSESDGECFIELYASPFSDLSLYEIALVNGSNGEETDHITLPLESLVPENGIFVIADLRTNSTSTSKVETFHYLDQFDPQNGPDAIQLFDRNGNLLDALWYGEGAVEQTPDGLDLGEGLPAPDAGAGKSLSRVEGKDTQDNGADFVELEDPTPGTL